MSSLHLKTIDLVTSLTRTKVGNIHLTHKVERNYLRESSIIFKNRTKIFIKLGLFIYTLLSELGQPDQTTRTLFPYTVVPLIPAKWTAGTLIEAKWTACVRDR